MLQELLKCKSQILGRGLDVVTQHGHVYSMSPEIFKWVKDSFILGNRRAPAIYCLSYHSGNNLLGLNTYVHFNPTLVCPCPRLFDFVFPLVCAWLSQRRRPVQNKQQTAAVENIWPSLMSAWQLMILTCNPAPKSELKGKPLWSVVVQRRNDQLFVI